MNRRRIANVVGIRVKLRTMERAVFDIACRDSHWHTRAHDCSDAAISKFPTPRL
jgi:hypothetical protein